MDGTSLWSRPTQISLAFRASECDSYIKYWLDRIPKYHALTIYLRDTFAIHMQWLGLVFALAFLLFLMWTSRRFIPQGSAESRIDRLLQRISSDRSRVIDLEEIFQTQRKQIIQLQSDLTRERNTGANQRTVNANLVKQLDDQKRLILRRQDSFNQQSRRIKKLEQEAQASKTLDKTNKQYIASLTSDKTVLESKLSVISSSMHTLRDNSIEVLRENVDLRVELDRIKLLDVTDREPQHHEESNFPGTPFVLVVVDGDAYLWDLIHFRQKDVRPGVHAAFAIKTAVQKYLLDSQGRLPVQSRIVTRVFYNSQSTTSLEGKIGHRSRNKIHSFTTEFTESMPLFDFTNCGTGKERADSKIQGTY